MSTNQTLMLSHVVYINCFIKRTKIEISMNFKHIVTGKALCDTKTKTEIHTSESHYQHLVSIYSLGRGSTST